MKLVRLWLIAMITLSLVGIILSGCGEKIAIPEPVGLYSGSPYRIIDTFEDPEGPVQLTIANNTLLVLTPAALTKRDQNYGEIGVVEGLDDARALCVDELEDLVFVYEGGSGTVSWFNTTDLALVGSTVLDAVQDVSSMVTSSVGVEQFPGAESYLYLADPDSAVVHRYAFDPVGGLNPHGILCRANGDAARFVHEPAGLALDSQDSLLVCDMDTNRNWVIRFNSTPDITDTSENPEDQDPLRGRAALWPVNSGCLPAPAADFVLGNATECGETGWVGGTSTEQAEFNQPQAMAVDGSGRIFVADTGNSRVQVFAATGEYVLLFGNPDVTPQPISLGLIDVISDPANNIVNYGAYVFVLPANANTVLKYISNEQANDEGLPPPEIP